MPKEMRKGKISEPNLEEQGIFAKRFKSHNDSAGIVSDYFRKNKKFGTEEELLERMEKPAENELGTIYVHTPYCDKICSFCNLNRKQIDNDLEDYTSFLVSEFEKYGKTPYMKSKKITINVITKGFNSKNYTLVFNDPQNIQEILNVLYQLYNK